MRPLILFAFVLCSLHLCASVVNSEADIAALKALVARQNQLLSTAAAKTTQADINDMANDFQKLAYDYDDYVARYPDFAAGYVAYAQFLANPLFAAPDARRPIPGDGLQRKRAIQLLLRANQLEPDIPLVKNQLGNYLAEEARPLEAIQYYLEAIRLDPGQPLYHLQLGTLLAESRDTFIASGNWTPSTVDQTMLDAFARAAALAPNNPALAYQHALAYYDLSVPDWPAALAAWRALASRMTTPVEKQAIQLHEANILLRQGSPAAARALIDRVTEPSLAANKKRLLDQLSTMAAPGGASAAIPTSELPRITFPRIIP
ncbi:hypothetical protein, partial [Geminisphaera colitermitum]|uniref:hypothetical protein n=1 Tax=Geminisphaera colitermitum TaxID=1148786 RepID=UPI0006943FC2